LETFADLDNEYVSITLDQSLDDLFGAEADLLLAQHHLVTDPASRTQLLREIGTAVHFVQQKLNKNTSGDFSPDENAARFPEFEPAAHDSPAPKHVGSSALITVLDLFKRWWTYNSGKKAASTHRRYGPSIESLAKYLKGKDVRFVTQDDIWEWAEHRKDKDGIAPSTVNRNDLVAAASIFHFATTRHVDIARQKDKKPLRTDNPVHGVKLDLDRHHSKRDKVFRAAEVTEILTLTRSVCDPRYPRASASRRWAPWICAYSGARIQEVCWLSKEDIWREGGIWVMRFPRTKTGDARIVPLHDALIDEGLLEFWKKAPDGFLFVGDRSQKPEATRTPQEQRASEIAAWIQEKVKLEEGASPNHFWRHTFITRCNGLIDKRMANAIAGHNKKRDASDGYFAPSVEMMKTDLDKYPRYVID